MDQSFTKSERICSKTLIGELFAGAASRSLAAFPVRAVYTLTERIDGDPEAMVLISVPKKCFKRAVKRNRVKRQVREAWRKNRSIITSSIEASDDFKNKKLLIAFIWLDDKLRPTPVVESKITNLLHRISEKLKPDIEKE